MENETKIKELFKKNFTKESYSLFDSRHPLNIYLGVNRHGQQSLLTISDSEKIEITPSKFVDANYEKLPRGQLALSFSLTNDNFAELFYRFCDDIIRNTAKANLADGFRPIVHRYKAWQNFFKKENNHLSENEIKGLIGELLFIKHFMIPKYGPNITIESYIGAERAHKDFELGDTWHEVKTVHNGASVVTISSLAQLDSSRIGHLNIVTLDSNTTNKNSVTLNRLVDEVKKSLSGAALSRFEDKLLDIGYLDDEYYDLFNYLVISAVSYRVDKDFPKLTLGTIPLGVVNAKYEIDLSAIASYGESTWI